jgi:hypothetical protein
MRGRRSEIERDREKATLALNIEGNSRRQPIKQTPVGNYGARQALYVAARTRRAELYWNENGACTRAILLHLHKEGTKSIQVESGHRIVGGGRGSP